MQISKKCIYTSVYNCLTVHTLHVYNTENRTVTATVTNKIDGDDLTLSYKTTGNTTSLNVESNVAKNADTYTFQLKEA